MIFTLFLLCSFGAHSTCTVAGTTYTLWDTCLHVNDDAGCKTDCEAQCTTDESNTNDSACLTNLQCFDTANHIYFATTGICGAADPDGANRLDCVKPCYDYCEANGGAEKVNAPCKTAIPCYDAAKIDECAEFCLVTGNKGKTGSVCETFNPCFKTIAAATDVTACNNYCGTNKGGNSNVAAACLAALPCAQAAAAVPLTTACGAVTTNIDCMSECATGCETNYDGNEALCNGAVKCTDVSTGQKVKDCLDFCDTNEALSTPVDTLCKTKLPCLKGTTADTAACAAAATNFDCYDDCLTHCSQSAVYSNPTEKGKCDAAIPCFDVSTDGKVATCKTFCEANIGKSLALKAGCAEGFPCEVNLGADVCGLYLAPGEGDGCTEAQCTAWCATGKPGDGNANCTTGKTTCTTVPCDNIAVPNSQTGCQVSFCIDFCKVKNNYDASGNKAKCDGVVPCFDMSTADLIQGCNTFCTGKSGAVRDFCDTQLACTAGFGTGACDDYMAQGVYGCTYAQCDAFCKFSGHGTLQICESDKPGKCNTEPCKHKIPSTGPTDALYCAPALCTAFCASDPCSTAKSTDCAAECTTWCEDSTNAESELCPEGEGSSFSIVLSLFVLLIALL